MSLAPAIDYSSGIKEERTFSYHCALHVNAAADYKMYELLHSFP